MKLLYHGYLWTGSTSVQRAEAFARIPGVTTIESLSGPEHGRKTSLWARVRWKLRLPIDVDRANAKLVEDVKTHRPDVVFVDNSRTIDRRTLREIRKIGDPLLVYYSPDDMAAPHNLSWPLKFSLPEWDIIFTTKTFNMPELRQMGVRSPVLIGNSYHPDLHRPMTPEEVGPDFERYDLVFVGTVERERMESIQKLAAAGMTVAVYGNPASSRGAKWQDLAHPNITSGPPAMGLDYSRKMHHGKIALSFMRKMNRDKITQRSIEVPAMMRPILGEKTDEQDQHFIDGEEYVGFVSDEDLIEKASFLLRDPERRAEIGRRALRRCHTSGYSTDGRAVEMLNVIKDHIARRAS